MTPFDKFIQYLTTASIDFWSFVKLFFLLALAIYIAFAFMVIRQVVFMSRTLNGSLNLPLKLVAFIHFLVAVGVWLLALIIL